MTVLLILTEVSRALSVQYTGYRSDSSLRSRELQFEHSEVKKSYLLSQPGNIEMAGLSNLLAWRCLVTEAGHVHLQAAESFSPSSCQCILRAAG